MATLSQALLGWWEPGNLNSGSKLEAFPAKGRPLEARCGVHRGTEGNALDRCAGERGKAAGGSALGRKQ